MFDKNNFNRTKYSCYYTYLASAPVFCLPPMLFSTFHNTYNISYTLLGTLVLINFCTQLIVDLLFSFFSKHFNIKKTICTMPVLCSLGMFVYAVTPTIWPQHAYIGLVIGTVIFSLSAGLSEVLLSPVVAAIPSKNAERNMSLLHSLYAYGVVTTVIISTLYFSIFGTASWMWLAFFFAALPLISCLLFCISPIPDLNLTHEKGEKRDRYQKIGIGLCTACIFLGGAAENSMTNWISVYMETVLGIPKNAGDILGIATFAILLATGRTLYAKYGKNILKALLRGMTGATLCYLLAGLSTLPVVSMIACILTGFCTSMLWPGTLILMEEKFPRPGVAIYALMAAGGDFGSSVAPQLLGNLVDKISASDFATNMGAVLSLTPEQIGLKFGMLVAALFPLLGTLLLLYMKRYFKKEKRS